MAKPPRARHSKAERDPVTIDLPAGDVSRVTAEAGKPADGAPQTASATTPESSGTATPAAQARPNDASTKPPKTAAPGSAPQDAPAASAKADAGPQRVEPPRDAKKPQEAGKAGPTQPAGGDKPAARPAGAVPPPAAKPASRRGGFLAGGIAGGVVALVLFTGLQFTGLWPAAVPPADDNDEQLAALQGEIAELRQALSDAGAAQATTEGLASQDRVDEIAGALDTLGAEFSGLRDEVAQLGTLEGEAVDLSPLEERLAALEAADGDAEANAETIAALDERVAAADQSSQEIVARLSGLEEELQALAARLDEQAGEASTALVIAASALRSAIDRGAPFATELDTVAALSPDAQGLEELRPYAADGVATPQELEAGMDAAANAMIASTRSVDAEAGFVERLFSSAEGLVSVRPVGMVDGEDVPSVVARMEALVRAGDYEQALAEYESLPDEAQAAGSDFAERLRARVSVDGEAGRVLSGALQPSNGG